MHQLSPSTLGHLIDFLEPEVAASLSLMVSSSTLPLVLDAASPDVAADVLKELPDAVAAAAIEHMTSGREVASLLKYDDDDAGGLMTLGFIALSERMNVSQGWSGSEIGHTSTTQTTSPTSTWWTAEMY